MSGREMRKQVYLWLGALALAACASPQPAPPPPPPRPPALRVAVPRNSPPYAFRRDGRMVGLEVDFAQELATALGRPLELMTVDWDDIIGDIEARRMDVAMAGLTVTPARAALIGFSDPFLRTGLVAVMRREDVPHFKTTASVLRTREAIGVVAGTIAERFVREHARNASVTVYPSALAAIDELRERRVTLVVHDAPVAMWFAAADEANLGVLADFLDDEQLAWGLHRDDATLRAAVNGVLAHWRKDGTRDRILARWVPYGQRREPGDRRPATRGKKAAPARAP